MAAAAAAPYSGALGAVAGANSSGGVPGSRAVPGIKYRHVGKSGLVVSNLALGNLTEIYTYGATAWSGLHVFSMNTPEARTISNA